MNKIILIILISLLMAVACSSVEENIDNSADGAFKKAMLKFEDEDYIEAEKLFDLIKLQYPASQYADDSQYYLAECNYRRNKFILAAYNYSTLRRLYPSSEYYKEALYKTAMCYYELSPTYERDQEYTKQAIQSLMEFQTVYPSDSLAEDSNKKIIELRDKLGRREYETGVLYRKLYSPRSSLVYFNGVINNFSDTEYYEPAMFGKIETLVVIRELDQAKSMIELYQKLFPKGDYISRISELTKKINNPELIED